MQTPPPPTAWTFSCQGAARSAAALGVSELVRRRTSAGPDVCLLTLASALDAPPGFPLGGAAGIARAGVGWFAGRVTALPASGGGAREARTVQLSGPWWYLEQLVYQQTWNLPGGAGPLSRLVLGQAADGTRLTTGEVIRDALQFAVDAGAPFQVGVVEPDLYPPVEAVRGLTCAQVIRRMLRWHPDCAAWFDYAAVPWPTLHCRARASLPDLTLTLGRAPLAAVRGLTALPAAQVPAVVLRYTTAAADGSGGWRLDAVADAAPADATGREFGAVVATLPLLGSAAPAGTGAGAGASVSATVAALTQAVFPARARLSASGQDAGPVSLAASALRARSALPYGGSVELLEADAGAAGDGLGRVLNVAGGADPAWAAMRALVVAEETAVTAGRTTWTLEQADGVAGTLQGVLAATRPGAEGQEPDGLAWLGLPAGEQRVSGRV